MPPCLSGRFKRAFPSRHDALGPGPLSGMLVVMACVAAASVVGACSDSAGGSCPPGEERDRADRCVPIRAADPSRPSAPERGVSESGEQPSADASSNAGSNPSSEASPSQGSSASPGDSANPQPGCTPGEFLRCDDRGSARVCDDEGRPVGRRVPCTAPTPTCLASAGGCTEQVCDPDQRYCDGDDLFQCSASGLQTERVTRCANGCSAGRCLDPCAEVLDKDSYLGCDFMAVWLDQAQQVRTNRRAMSISLANAGDREILASISDGLGATVTELSIPAGDLVRVPVNLGGDSRVGSRIGRTAWRVSADGPLTAHQFNPPDNQGQFSNDASLLLPIPALGTDYMVLSWPSYRWALGLVQDQNRSMMAVVATAPDTTVIVQPTTDIEAGPDVPAIPAGTEATFLLGEGQVLYLFTPPNRSSTPLDPSGTRVIADRPIAVFSGHQCAFVPDNVNYCDHIEQQMVPTNAWGQRHIGAMFAQRGAEDAIYRVIALRGGTGVQTFPPIAGVDGTTLASGEVVTFRTDLDFLLEADGPVAMGQFMVGSNDGCRENQHGVTVECRVPRDSRCMENEGIGDPAYLLSVPSSQFLPEYVFLVPDQYRVDHISVIRGSTAEVRLNGAPLTGAVADIPGTPWSVQRQQIEPGVHRIESDAPFGLHVYGYDCAVSYAYPGGMGLAPL